MGAVAQGSGARRVDTDEVALYQVTRGAAGQVKTVPVVARDDVTGPRDRPADDVVGRLVDQQAIGGVAQS